MIQHVGTEGSAEWECANRIRGALLNIWPDLETDPLDRVLIVSSCKIYGYEVQDLDIVLCLNFENPRLFQPIRPVRCQQDGQSVRRDVMVKSLCVVIEVKGHDQSGVRFDGASAKVLYRRNGKSSWHDATEQSMKQAHSLKSYLSDTLNDPVYVTNLIHFENLEEADFPVRPHNFVAGRASGRSLMTVIADVARPWIRPSDGCAQLSAAKDGAIARAFLTPAFKQISPTPLDRL